MIDIYCGDRNCYELLGVSRESDRKEISKAYRRLAQKWHPDMFRSQEDKEVAEKKFMKIATAYETLRDEESRADYDYMLDHPEEMWRNMYRYYRRRVGPKVDVRYDIVICNLETFLVFLIDFSIFLSNSKTFLINFVNLQFTSNELLFFL